MNKIAALQATKHSYKTVPIFLKQAEKTGLFDKYYICTDINDPYGLNDKCIIHRVNDMGYSSNILSLIEIINEELIFLMLEDFVLEDNIDTKRAEQCFQFALQNTQIGFLRMRVGREQYRKKLFAKSPKQLCRPVRKDHKHYICLQPGLWRKEFIKYCFKENENAWECELNGRDRGKKHKFFDSYCTTRSILASANFIIKGHPTPPYIVYLIQNRIPFKHLGDNPQVLDKYKKVCMPLVKYLEKYKIRGDWRSLL